MVALPSCLGNGTLEVDGAGAASSGTDEIGPVDVLSHDDSSCWNVIATTLKPLCRYIFTIQLLTCICFVVGSRNWA